MYRKIAFYLASAMAFAASLHAGVITAEVLGASRVVDAASAPYADCNFALKIKDSSGKSAILITPVFLNRKYTVAAALRPGSVIRTDAADFDTVPANIRSRCLADDFSDIELPYYYAAAISVVAGQDRTGQDRTGQDRTGQDRTGQDRTGQDRTGQGLRKFSVSQAS